MKRFAIAVLVVGAAAVPALAQPGPPNAGPTPVTVVALEAQDVTLTSTLPGRVLASGVAEVRPQVNGIITDRLFHEGANVEVGDPLYRIDDASYQAIVAAAKAQVSQAEAQLRAAEREATRVASLIERNVVSLQASDEAIAKRDSAAAQLEVAKADLLAAQINLQRTTISAPLSGVIGRTLTTQGALVTDGQASPLAVIRTIDPVLVDVTQSAAELIAWRRGEVAERLAGTEPIVSLILADGSTYGPTGSLTVAEPYVNEQTGVVTLRMEFPNPELLLLPGMYVQVEMPQAVAHNVVLAPQQGITRDRRGRPIAMVANSDDIVEERVVSVMQALGNDWVVSDGLKQGDRLIVEGLQKIRPGAPVAPELRPTETKDIVANAG